MRLAVASPFVDRSHGTERALAELLERLAYRYGCEIHLFSQRVAGLRISDASTIEQANGSIIWHRVPSMPGPHLIQFLAWLALNAAARIRCLILERRSFDLLLSPGINSFSADFIVVHALFHRLRDLSREAAHQRGTDSRPLRGLHRRLYYSLLVALERRIYRNPNVFLLAVSKRTATLLAQTCGRDEVPVVPNGVDTTQFSPSVRLARRKSARSSRQLNDSDILLLLIGNDWKNKGALTVMKALAACRDFSPRFLIVGDDDPQPFREHTHLLGVDARCLWQRSQSDVMDFYAAADIYVCPSQEDSFGLPVLEAMASGLPVVTSRFAGVSELITNGVDGFVLDDPHDVPALSQLLRSLILDENLRTRCAQAAVATAAKWTWDRNAAAIWELLNSACQQRTCAAG